MQERFESSHTFAPWRRAMVGIQVEGRHPLEAMELAGLNWDVQTVSVEVGEIRRPFPRARAVVREDTGAPLGIVGPRYRPIQNSDMFRFADALLTAERVRLDTAGVIDEGRKVWALLTFDDVLDICGDTTRKFLLLTNSHDGSGALRILFTPVRVACSNTLTMALRLGAGEGITVRHTSAAAERLESARRSLHEASTYFEGFRAEAHRLRAARFTDRDMLSLADALAPADANDRKAHRPMRDRLLELFSDGMGHGPIRGTAWAALNAVAEYVDHHRPQRAANERLQAERRLGSIWYGAGAELKRQAHTWLAGHIATA